VTSGLRLALLGAAILGTAAAGVAAAVPVTTASFGLAETTVSGGARMVSLPGYGARGTDVLDYQDRADVVLRLPLRNTGRFAVTVTDVSLDGQRLELLTEVAAPAPFTLAPGQTREVALLAVLGNCRYYHEREVHSYDGVRVRFETLGGKGARHVAFVRPIVVHSPMIVGCADRKLDREAFNRRDG
jgi:hypothetical protein